jgi:hypothetical protein
MKVYHGSYVEIGVIDLSKCEINRDFGKGFYVTNIYEQAVYWAERKGKRQKDKGHVTEFTFYENALKHYHLNVLRFDGYTEEWLDFVVMNRNPENPEPSHDYDIVEGPVADDDIAQRIHDYLNGDVSRTDFLEELKFKHKPSHQIAFCTVKALQMLDKKENKEEREINHINDAITQRLVAEYGLSGKDAIDLYFNSDTYSQLTDETAGLYRKSWQEIYETLKQELNDILSNQ